MLNLRRMTTMSLLETKHCYDNTSPFSLSSFAKLIRVYRCYSSCCIIKQTNKQKKTHCLEAVLHCRHVEERPNSSRSESSHFGNSANSGGFVVVEPPGGCGGEDRLAGKRSNFLFHLIYLNMQASGETHPASRHILTRQRAAAPRGRKAAHLNLGSDSKLPFLC